MSPTSTLGRVSEQLRKRFSWAISLLGSVRERLVRAVAWSLRGTARPHGLGHELVVSLTSYPPRYGCLAATIRTILSQRVRPDRVVLWIAESDVTSLPDEVVRLERHGLEILATEDLRSYKKIIPALAAFPDAVIVTADDDVRYRPSWLGELVAASGGRPGLVVCGRGHFVRTRADGRLLPYREWDFNIGPMGPSPSVFPTGCGGVLYPPRLLPPEVANVESFMAACPQGDDIWLYWMGRMNGATYRNVGRGGELMTWPGSQDVALWLSNVEADANDDQIARMVAVYGLPGTPSHQADRPAA